VSVRKKRSAEEMRGAVRIIQSASGSGIHPAEGEKAGFARPADYSQNNNKEKMTYKNVGFH
jgi:hypothetical protein